MYSNISYRHAIIKNLFEYVNNGGIYIIEDFKHPNYYDYNRNIKHVLMDQVLANLQEKKIFNSNIIKNDDQVYLHNNINKIEIYKGNLKDSDICFLKMYIYVMRKFSYHLSSPRV